MPAQAWEQASLPISQGGLGIRDPESAWREARIAALIRYHAKATTVVGTPQGLSSKLSSDTSAVLDSLATTLGPHFDPVSLWVKDPSAIVKADKQYSSQKWWTEQVTTARKAQLRLTGTARDQARMLSQEGPLASAWLTPWLDTERGSGQHAYRC